MEPREPKKTEFEYGPGTPVRPHAFRSALAAVVAAVTFAAFFLPSSPFGVSAGIAIAISMAAFTGTTIILAGGKAVSRRMRRRLLGPGTCRECGYSLAYLPENRCPECGTPIPIPWEIPDPFGRGFSDAHSAFRDGEV